MGAPLYGEPNLGWPTASVSHLRPCQILVQKQSQRGADPIRGLDAPTQKVPNGCPRQSFATGALQRPQNVVRDRTAKRVPEDKGGRGLAIFPDRQCCPQMRDADLCLPVEQDVDERKANYLRLRSRGDRTQ